MSYEELFALNGKKVNASTIFFFLGWILDLSEKYHYNVIKFLVFTYYKNIIFSIYNCLLLEFNILDN